MDKSMLYFGGIMLGVFGLVSVVNNLLPPPINQQVGGLVFLVGVIGGIGGLEVSYILRTSAYPHILMLVRPENEKVELFVDVPQSRKKPMGGNRWSTTLQLKFPRKIKAYGDAVINQIRIIHEYEYEQRIQYKPGQASLDDYDFNHPQTEYIEVVQLAHKQTSIDRSEVIPEFQLLSARNDYRLHLNGSVPQPQLPGTKVVDPDKEARIRELETNLAQVKNDANYFHQQYIKLNEIVELKSVETSGLLDQKGGIKDFSIEYVLTLLTALGNLQKVADHLRGTAWNRYGKWMFITAITCFSIFVVWQNPQWLDGIYLWANNPQNQLTLALVLTVAVVSLLYFFTRRR